MPPQHRLHAAQIRRSHAENEVPFFAQQIGVGFSPCLMHGREMETRGRMKLCLDAQMKRGRAQILMTADSELWFPFSSSRKAWNKWLSRCCLCALEHNPEFFHQLVIATKMLLEIYACSSIPMIFKCHVSTSATESFWTYALGVIEYVVGPSNIKKSFLYDRATIYSAI